jgi:hypothetical protein
MPQVLICRNFLQYNNVQKRIWSGPLHRYTQKDPKKFISYFLCRATFSMYFLNFYWKKEIKKRKTSEQHLCRFRPKASACWLVPAAKAAWPAAMEAARAASARAHDVLGAVVTACRVAMVARLSAPTLAMRPGEIGGRRTSVKRCSRRATS